MGIILGKGWSFASCTGPGEEYNIYGDSDTELPSMFRCWMGLYRFFLWCMVGDTHTHLTIQYMLYTYLYLIILQLLIFILLIYIYIHDLAVAERNLVPVGVMHNPSCSRLSMHPEVFCMRSSYQFGNMPIFIQPYWWLGRKTIDFANFWRFFWASWKKSCTIKSGVVKPLGSSWGSWIPTSRKRYGKKWWVI